MNVLSLFSGIGGGALGLEMAGMRVVGLCERQPFARRVLQKHWPDVPIFKDVHEVDVVRLAEHRIPRVDLICGGFPCQPFSLAGKRLGATDERHLWPEFARVIGEVRPPWVIAENVPGIRSLAADEVLSDLEALGYACWPVVVGAVHTGAPHRRQRAWFVAHTNGEPEREGRADRSPQIKGRRDADRSGFGAAVCHADCARLAQRQGERSDARAQLAPAVGADWWATEPDVGRVAHGVPDRVDRIKGLGNAVVPQVIAMIGAWIMAQEQTHAR